ncbi:MAG TPA: hypothetical protein VFS50_12240 [Meiothermus sp.]|nr:hypothetical protein [Meiothermus sp.]
MKKLFSILAVILVLLLAACGGGGGLAPGSIQATILGVPAGTDAKVRITGPNGFSETLTASKTLANLTPGAYSVDAQSVNTGSGIYTATSSATSLQVQSGQTTPLNVTYAPPPGSSTSSTLDVATGGTLTLGPATLTIPPGAFVGGSTATVTLKSLGKPTSTDPGDPLKYVSDAYTVSATLASGFGPSSVTSLRVNPEKPPVLSITPNGDALNNTQSLIVGNRDPQTPGVVNLYRPTEADQGPKFGPISYTYTTLDKAQWVVAIPKLVQKPQEKEVLQVPWYYQSGIPWCAPTSLTAMLRYYDFNETVFDDAENADFGNSMALANWQVAQLQNQDRDSGGGWPLDQVGLAGKYTIYLWDAAAFLPDSGAKGGFNDFLVYTVLVNTGLFGLFDRRPLVMGVDMWWHSVTVVGVDGDGLYYHDSNGDIAKKTTWDQFQQDATGWKKDAQGKQIFVQTIFTGVLNTSSGVALRPETARRGSIAFSRGGVSFDKNGGGTATLEWDADSPHSYGYYFKDGTTATDSLQLGATAKPGGNLSYSFRVANVTNVDLPFTVEVSLANSSGAPIGSPSTSSVSVPARSWNTASSLVSGTLTVPDSGGSAMLIVKLKQGGVLQDVKYLRFRTPLILK